MAFRKGVLAGSVSGAALLCLVAPSLAAAAAPSASSSEVVVVGIRQSLQQSLQDKRTADVILDVITAEDIGKFPDKNVAESLQRVPGVTISREFGEGERISIRGTAPTLNLTQLNGHAVSTADWFILDQLKASRSFNYLMLPSEIVGRLDVYKSPEADISEGGVGGMVNVHTRNPLDLDPTSVAATAQAFIDEKSGKVSPVGSALLSWHNPDKTFGILVGGMYDKREIRRDGMEVLGYETLNVPAAGTQGVSAGTVTGVPPGTSVIIPSLIGSTLFRQTRERIGGNVGIQWRPSDQWEFNLTGLYSHMDADNLNQNFMFWGTSKNNALAVTPGEHFNASNVVGGVVTAGTFDAPGGAGAVFDAIDRLAHTQVRAINMDGTWRPNMDWKFSGQVGYTDAVGNTDHQPFWETTAATGVTYDLSGGLPKVHFTDINPAVDATKLGLGWASNNTILNDDKEFYGKFDGERFIEGNVFKSIAFGARYTDHDRDVDVTYGQRRALLPWTAPGGTACAGHPCTLADVAGGLTPTDFLAGIAGPGVLSQYIQADSHKIESFYNALPPADIYNADPNGTQPAGCAGLLNCNHYGPNESFVFNEKTWAGYMMGKFEGDSWRGNIGVRVVRTRDHSVANTVGVASTTPGAIPNPFGFYVPTASTKTYTDILPSANFAFDLRQDLVFRAAAGRVVARPDYAQMVGFTALTDSLLTGNGGNPNLDPYRATQFDGSLEWYFAKQSLLAVDLFYKDVSTYIVSRAVTERHTLAASATLPGGGPDPRIANPANHCVMQAVSLYTCDYVVGRPVNAAGGVVDGLEVNYQQPLWNGFGVQANYTYTHASSQSGVPIPSTSKHAFNATGYYENRMFSARVSYNYRSAYFIDYDSERANRPLYSGKIGDLDASVDVNVTKNVSLTFDVQNILDTTLHEYYDNNANEPARIYKNGRMFFIGARAKF